MISLTNLIRFGPSVAAALALAAFVWWVMDLRADKAALTRENDALTAELAVMEDQRALARAAALLAQKERARMSVAAAKYENIRTAFRKGNFDDPLPDDFRHLVRCLLRQSTGGDAPDCP